MGILTWSLRRKIGTPLKGLAETGGAMFVAVVPCPALVGCGKRVCEAERGWDAAEAMEKEEMRE